MRRGSPHPRNGARTLSGPAVTPYAAGDRPIAAGGTTASGLTSTVARTGT
ncbi:hypothetical protein [Microbispora sp. ATCC PTA-5024]|nr:hypothetical protein [Microbispora sp. ATCC PTA-5024]